MVSEMVVKRLLTVDDLAGEEVWKLNLVETIPLLVLLVLPPVVVDDDDDASTVEGKIIGQLSVLVDA